MQQRGEQLNAICPYFTMFPLSFPLRVLRGRAKRGDVVFDPFCGRGTTNFAARMLGLHSIGFDSSPVATAISESKLVKVSPRRIVAVAREALSERPATELPVGEFWRRAFHEETLFELCQLRESLMRDCQSSARKALRGLVLGALHGPLAKREPSYFSNQSPRTFSPKPRYAVDFWRRRGLRAPRVDALRLIERRARRYFADLTPVSSEIRLADSRKPIEFENAGLRGTKWIVTSPPYYGMRTYVPDQWLRSWFVGARAAVDYRSAVQVAHTGPEVFASNLRDVWTNCASVASKDAHLVVRFGGIRDRAVDPLSIIKDSLDESGWRVVTIRSAGYSDSGKRQADTFLTSSSKPIQEYDVWARRS